ncbi:hydroxysteroid dehydrogenase-like protein 3 [Dinothrombium tinctorium]|uniref:Hydroxysteroid dehydrogenase-like protein 3 n=1 Tax=Dinothrombium tinctorium TaxID=1965070 RepID=A0A3S3P503_9ACAR|nr:hydroxysteroid dehydrogenase-like protein 3 [Dinothrombium tinctorium]RWS15046.1 hydroxysteroid dehydrogenase-like protein 3 [Dinothrombium tinctorium]
MDATNKIKEYLNPYLHILILTVGALVSFAVVLIVVFEIFKGIRVFIWSRILKVDLISRYGEYVIVTGATDGIGIEFAKQFAQRGHSIVIFGRNANKLSAAKSLISRYLYPGKKIISIQADFNEIYDNNIYQKIENQLLEIKGKTGILVNNAGVFLKKPDLYLNLDEDEVFANVKVNIIAVLMMTRIVLPFMVSNRKGLIINVSSLAAFSVLPSFGVYGASKKFVEYFSKSIEYEYKRYNIDVQTLVPAYIITKMVGWSNHLNKPSVLYPSAEVYVKSAIATITRSNHTTGYWLHGLFYTLNSLFVPSWVYTLLTHRYNRYLNTSSKTL